jgi:hypothetical protein
MNTPTLRALGLLVSLGLPLSAAASDAPREDEGWSRIPQLAIEVGGSWSQMRHPTTYVPARFNEVRQVHAREGAARLSGGLHFNLLRGSGRSDFWWTNGVDWYLAGGDVEVLAFRPGLEKRFSLSRKLTLGVSAFGGIAEVAVPTGRLLQNLDPTGAPIFQEGFSEAKAARWIFGAGAAGALQANFGRFVYTRVQVGYTHFFQKAEGFEASPGQESFSVSLSGPMAGASIGVNL